MTPLDGAACLMRAWTSVYTRRLPREVAAARRTEIECDLWEMRHDPSVDAGVRAALVVVRRLVEGVADDLMWRFEQGSVGEQLLLRRVIGVAAAVALVAGLWITPPLLTGGVRNVSACAGRTPAPENTSELRLELMRCAGAFFLARDKQSR